ncbi:unnamed protein product, partial [Linum tenue]
ENKKRALLQAQFIPFSAFWLRSSVVSVLISLISDTWVNGPHDIKLIFLGGEAHHWSLLQGLLKCRPCVALLHGPGAPHQFQFNDFSIGLKVNNIGPFCIEGRITCFIK